MKALEILKECLENEKDIMKGYENLSNIDYIQEAIAELEALQAPKACETCSHRLDPNRQFQSFSCALLKRHVRNDFYCADYEPKDKQ